MAASSYGVSRVYAGEGDCILTPTDYSGGRPVVVFCHGAGGTATAVCDPTLTGQYKIAQALAAVYPVICTDLGGTQTWGNATVQARIATCRTYAQASMGAKAGGVILVGVSMGNVSALNYAFNNPGNVLAVVSLIGMTSLASARAIGFGAAVEAAWGIGAGAALPAGADPSLNMRELSAIKYRSYYDLSDTIATPATAAALVRGVGGSESTTTGLGHSEAAIAAIDPNDILAWLRRSV